MGGRLLQRLPGLQRVDGAHRHRHRPAPRGAARGERAQQRRTRVRALHARQGRHQQGRLALLRHLQRREQTGDAPLRHQGQGTHHPLAQGGLPQQGDEGLGRGHAWAGGQEAHRRAAHALVHIRRRAHQDGDRLLRVVLRHGGEGHQPRGRILRLDRLQQHRQRIRTLGHTQPQERRPAHVRVPRDGRAPQGLQRVLRVQVGQRVHHRHAHLARLVVRQCDDGVRGGLFVELPQRLARVVAHPGILVGEASQQTGRHPGILLRLPQGPHRGRAGALRVVARRLQQRIHRAWIVDEGQAIDGRVPEPLIRLAHGTQQHIQPARVPEVGDDAQGRAPLAHIRGARRLERQRLRLVAAERLDGAHRRLHHPGVLVRQALEQVAHGAGLAQAREGIGREHPHRGVLIPQTQHHVLHRRRAPVHQGQQQQPPGAVALPQGLEQRHVRLGAHLLERAGRGAGHGGLGVQHRHQARGRLHPARPPHQPRERRLFRGVGARQAPGELAPQLRQLRPAAQRQAHQPRAAKALNLRLVDLHQRHRRHAHHRVRASLEQPHQRGHRRLLARAAQGPRRLGHIEGVRQQPQQRGHHGGIPGAAQHIDGGEDPEEVAAAQRRQQRVHRGAAADAAQGLDGGHRHVVIRVHRQRCQQRHRAPAPAAAQDLGGIANDGGVGVVAQRDDRLVHLAGGSHQRVHGGGQSGFAPARAAQHLAQRHHRGRSHARQRANHGPAHRPAWRVQLLEERLQAGGAAAREGLHRLHPGAVLARQGQGMMNGPHGCSGVTRAGLASGGRVPPSKPWSRDTCSACSP
ncbi:hypothetical protein STIAU_0569 [Stigmatella aurantiaca DW4/3-1]|uniref:Uncharacterized protein n=1 Tax=Stigmatella aurantiaca (strain DW4/3-1) TaxID=378806 RepID=Q091N3_STIAD|nr:hypothetical protein STIAU_0569 [Stigmatella aurantiaca DW4/3-1]